MSPSISVIVCHRHPQLLADLKRNLDATIGVPYEVIVVDNSKNEYSIFQAYNEGVDRSTGDMLCFAHEDILFHTQDWGKRVMAHFEDENLGMIGVAGANLFPSCPAPWWAMSSHSDHLIHLIQHWTTKQPKQKYYTFLNDSHTVAKAHNNPQGQETAPAVVVDGLWFCIPKSLFEHIRFDEETFKGFHCYDTDISLQVFQKKDVKIIFDILIEHYSDANANKEFLDACIAHFYKWRGKLPAMAKKLPTDRDVADYEFGAMLEFAYTLLGHGLHSDREIRQVISDFLSTKRFVPSSKDAWLLYLWSRFGYNLARYPYFFVRNLI